MKIGFIKYASAIFLDMENEQSSWGGVRGRRNLLRMLEGAGHQIVILNEIHKDHMDSFKRLLPKAKYDPVGFPKVDFLLIDCGIQNFMYKQRDGVPHLVRSNRVISNHEGLVIYWQNDIVLNALLNLDSLGPAFFDAGYHIGASALDLTRNKTWVVLPCAASPQGFLQRVSGNRSPYMQLGIPAETWQSSGLGIEKYRKVNYETTYDFTYIGNQRSRISYFKKYTDIPKHRLQVFGKWSEELQTRFNGASFHGRIPQGRVIPTLNKSACTILIGDRGFIECAHYAERYFEGVAAGTIVLIDEPFHFWDTLTTSQRKHVPAIPGRLVVTEGEERGKVHWANTLPPPLRSALVDECRDGIAYLSSEGYLLGRLFEIVNKYKDKDLQQNKKHKEFIEKYIEGLEASGDEDKERKAKTIRSRMIVRFPRPFRFPRGHGKKLYLVTGINGAGKTSVVREFVKKQTTEKVKLSKKYPGEYIRKHHMMVMGYYSGKRVMAGTDLIPRDKLWKLLLHWLSYKEDPLNILMEGERFGHTDFHELLLEVCSRTNYTLYYVWVTCTDSMAFHRCNSRQTVMPTMEKLMKQHSGIKEAWKHMSMERSVKIENLGTDFKKAGRELKEFIERTLSNG